MTLDTARRTRLESMQNVREVRRLASAEMECRAAAGGLVTFRGLASRTATPYDMGTYKESISRGAFGETLKRSPDVQLLINHDGLPLARTTVRAGEPGSLVLSEDTDGLQFEALCDPADQDVMRIRSKVESGLMDQCSFGFRVIRQAWRWMEDTGADADQRDIQEVSLDRGDVSIVNYGANPATNVTARSLLEAMSEDEMASLPADVLERLANAATRRAAVAAPAEPVVLAPVHSLDYYRAMAWTLGQKR